MNGIQQYNPSSSNTIDDPLYSLPFDIITNIITLLPQAVRVECLKVSRLWRTQILACAKAWSILSLENGEQDDPLADLAYDISKHVMGLRMTTTSATVCSQFLKQLRAGSFTRVRSLKIAEPVINELEAYQNEVAESTIYSNVAKKSLQTLQLGNTLTCLDINIGKSCNPDVSIVEVIATFPNLTDLRYSSKSRLYLQIGYFYDLMTTPHQHMVNLELRAYIISKTDIKAIITFCPKLRRLVLNRCPSDVLHAIVECQNITMKNLEILAFNSDNIHPPIPTLSSLSTASTETTTRKNTATMSIRVTNDDVIEESTEEKGLRILYTNNGGTPVPARDILPLIYQNRKTLETVYACISVITETELQGFYKKFKNFELEKIKNLTTWAHQGIQELMLCAIRNSVSLVRLNLLDLGYMKSLVDTLINMPPLCHIKFVGTGMTRSDREQFIQLLKRYAQLANDGNTVSLRSIAIQQCDHVITDEILEALSNIKTLEEVWLSGPIHTSAVEIYKFIAKLGKQHLKEIYFDNICVITDTTLATVLGDMVDTLTYIKLKGLYNISDDGIRILIDKKTHYNDGLSLLVIENCPHISPQCIDHARKKVKVVVYNKPFSASYLSLNNKHYYALKPYQLL